MFRWLRRGKCDHARHVAGRRAGYCPACGELVDVLVASEVHCRVPCTDLFGRPFLDRIEWFPPLSPPLRDADQLTRFPPLSPDGTGERIVHVGPFSGGTQVNSDTTLMDRLRRISK